MPSSTDRRRWSETLSRGSRSGSNCSARLGPKPSPGEVLPAALFLLFLPHGARESSGGRKQDTVDMEPACIGGRVPRHVGLHEKRIYLPVHGRDTHSVKA